MSNSDGRESMSGREDQGSPLHRDRVVADTPEWWPQEDELDLVDLGASLWQRRWLIVSVFGAVLLTGVIFALLRTPTYSYSAVVHIGSYTLPNGNVVPLEPASSSKATMASAYVPGAIRDYIAAHPKMDPRRFKIEVRSPKRSSVIQLEAKGPNSLGPALRAIEAAAAQLLVKFDGRKTDVIRAKLTGQLGDEQLKLQQLQDPSYFQGKKLAKEQAVADAQAKLADLQGQSEVLKAQLANEKSLGEIYAKRAKNLMQYMATARKDMRTGGAVTQSANSAMGMLLLGTEMQRNADRLQQMEQDLTATIPNQLASIRQQMEQNSRQQLVAQKAVDQAQQAVKQFVGQHQRHIKSQKLKINEIQTRLDNLSDTSLVSKPTRSSLPVGVSRKTIVLLSAVLGIVLALLAALVSAYGSAVRERLRETSDRGAADAG